MNFISDINHQGAYNDAIAGKIVRRTNTSIVSVGQCNRYLTYLSTYPYDFEAPSPDLSPNIILGKLTGYYTIDSYYTGGPYYKCELQLFNHIWSEKGNPIYFVDLYIPTSNGFNSNIDFLLLTDTGAHTITGNVARSFFDRGGRLNYFLGVSYFPHLDPDYLLYSDPKKWDDYFNNTDWLAYYRAGGKYGSAGGYIGIPVNQEMINSYQDYSYKMPRTIDSFIYPSQSSAKSLTIQFGTFWGGGYLNTKGVNLYSDALCTNQIGTKESAFNKKQNFRTCDELTFTGLQQNTTYYARSYYVRYGNTLLGENESTTFTYLSTIYLLTTTIASVNPEVALGSPMYINNTSFTSTFEFFYEGDFNIKEAGMCYGTSPLPTIINNRKISTVRTAYETEDLIVTGLIKDTTYYIRAYAIKEDDSVIYGSPDRSFSFKTTNINTQTVPKLSAITLVNSSYNSANISAQVIANGGSSVIEKGVCWNLTGNPTIADAHLSEDGNRQELELYYVTIPGLIQASKVYIRGYATNSTGSGYSIDTYILKVPNAGIIVPTSPVIYMNDATGISNTTATFKGVISDLAGKILTSGGFKYRVIGGAWTNAFITGLSSTGLLLKNITGLIKETTYEVKISLNVGTTVYESSSVIFKTLPDPVIAPVISIDNTTNYKDSTSINLKGTIISLNGNSTPQERGFCWDVAGTPIITKITGKYVTGVIDSIANKFFGTITGLTPNTEYHTKSYISINGIVTLSSNEYSFTTNSVITIIAPIVTTQIVTGATEKYAIINALIVNNGTLTRKGIAINTSTLTGIGEPTGNYKLDTSLFTTFGIGFDLNGSTKYYARAFAQNQIGGIVWGNQVEFTTPSSDQIISVNSNSIIIQHSSVDVNINVIGTSTMNGVVYSEVNKLPTHSDSLININLDLKTNLKFYKVSTYYLRAFATDSKGRPTYGNVMTVVVDSISDNSLGFPRFPYSLMPWTFNGIDYVWCGYGWKKAKTNIASSNVLLNSKSFNN